MPFEQQSDRETTAETRADAQKGVYREGQLGQTMKTKLKYNVKVKKLLKWLFYTQSKPVCTWLLSMQLTIC